MVIESKVLKICLMKYSSRDVIFDHNEIDIESIVLEEIKHSLEKASILKNRNEKSEISPAFQHMCKVIGESDIQIKIVNNQQNINRNIFMKEDDLVFLEEKNGQVFVDWLLSLPLAVGAVSSALNDGNEQISVECFVGGKVKMEVTFGEEQGIRIVKYKGSEAGSCVYEKCEFINQLFGFVLTELNKIDKGKEDDTV